LVNVNSRAATVAVSSYGATTAGEAAAGISFGLFLLGSPRISQELSMFF